MEKQDLIALKNFKDGSRNEGGGSRPWRQGEAYTGENAESLLAEGLIATRKDYEKMLSSQGNGQAAIGLARQNQELRAENEMLKKRILELESIIEPEAPETPQAEEPKGKSPGRPKKDKN